MPDSEPDLIWIPKTFRHTGLDLTACVAAVALLAVRVWRVDSITIRWTVGWAMAIVEGIFTDPLLWLAVVVVIYGTYTWGGHELLFRCPHCGINKRAPDSIMMAALGTRWECDRCGNSFTKGTTPPLPRDYNALRELPPELNRVGAHRPKKQRYR